MSWQTWLEGGGQLGLQSTVRFHLPFLPRSSSRQSPSPGEIDVMGSLSSRNRANCCRLYRVTTAPLLIRPQKPRAALGGNQPPASMKGGVPNDRIASSAHFQEVCEIYIYIYYIPLLISPSAGAGEACHVVFELKRGTSRLGGGESGIIIPFQVPVGGGRGPTCGTPCHAKVRGATHSHPIPGYPKP